MSESEFETITCNRSKARENRRVQVAIGFGFHWLKKWREFYWPITERSNAKPTQTQVTFDADARFSKLPKVALGS